MLQIEPLPDLAALERLAPEWDALDRSLSPRTPFTSPLWNILWWSHFRENRRAVQDSLCAFALRDAAGTLVAVAPMMLTQRPRSGPLRFRCLQFFGADPNITELRGLACRPEQEGVAVDSLMHHLLADCARWDWLHWGAIRRDFAGHDRLDQTEGRHWRRDLPDYCLDLPEDWASLRKRLPRNIKESLRKCYNSLQRAGHQPHLHVIERPDAVGTALETFFALHQARAEADGLAPHPDLFSPPRARRFMSDYVQAMAQRGELRLFQLEIDGTIVATRVGLVLGRELYLYYSGYDPAWHRFSVMTTLVAEAIQWAIAQRLTLVNLSVGTDVSKTRWRPRAIPHREAIVTAPHARGHVAYMIYDRLTLSAGPTSPLGRLIARARRSRH